jgi:hypothetical protein
MSLATWKETLVVAEAAGAVLANSTTPTSLLPGQAICSLPPSFFANIGKSIFVRAQGQLSTFTSGTLTFGLTMGTLASPINAFASPAISLSGSQSNTTWDLEINMTCRSVGSGTATTLMGIGKFTAVAGATQITLLPSVLPGVGTGFDSTIANVVNLFATWSVANAANSIQLMLYSVEALN